MFIKHRRDHPAFADRANVGICWLLLPVRWRTGLIENVEAISVCNRYAPPILEMLPRTLIIQTALEGGSNIMEKALLSLREKAALLLPQTQGYARQQMERAIYEIEQTLGKLRDANNDRGPIHAQICSIMILLGEGGLYDQIE